MNAPKPTIYDYEAAEEWFATNPDNRSWLEQLASIIARHMEPQRELLRELAEMNCYSMTDHVNGVFSAHPCGECLPCRARKLLEESK